MTDKKTRYTLTAAVGNGKAGSFIELTDAQAKSPLYASRIAALPDGGVGSISYQLDVEVLKAELLESIKEEAEAIVADAKAAAAKLTADAQAEAVKLVDAAKAEATTITDKAAADAKAAAAKK